MYLNRFKRDVNRVVFVLQEDSHNEGDAAVPGHCVPGGAGSRGREEHLPPGSQHRNLPDRPGGHLPLG